MVRVELGHQICLERSSVGIRGGSIRYCCGMLCPATTETRITVSGTESTVASYQFELRNRAALCRRFACVAISSRCGPSNSDMFPQAFQRHQGAPRPLFCRISVSANRRRSLRPFEIQALASLWPVSRPSHIGRPEVFQESIETRSSERRRGGQKRRIC